MSSLNRVILIGRVAAAPELRYTASGKAVASFRLAVDRRGGGSGDNSADFFSIVAWQRLAEICNEFLTKGKLIAIDGRLQSRTYDSQDGQKRTVYEIVAEDMRMLSGRNENGEAPREYAGGGGGYRDRGAREQSGGDRGPSGGGGGDRGGEPGGGDFGGRGFRPQDDDLGMDDVPF